MVSSILECRRRVLQLGLIFLCWFILFFYFSDWLFQSVMMPLNASLSSQTYLIATEVTASVLIPIRLAFYAALLSTAPFLLWHVWRFVSPALYRAERYGFAWCLLASSSLFCLGLLFCFYIVLPLMFHVLLAASPVGVHVMPDIAHTLSFMLYFLFIFGLCFQLPLIGVLFVWLGVLRVDQLKAGRSYAIVFAFIIGMLLTPPDVLSQLMLAVPLCLLYEGGIVGGLWVERWAGRADVPDSSSI